MYTKLLRSDFQRNYSIVYGHINKYHLLVLGFK